MSVNSAYMMWRQFSGEAKPTAGQQRGSLKAVAQQAPIYTGNTTAQALDTALNSLAGFAKTYQQGVQREENEADTKVKAWMRTMPVEEYRKKIQEANTPFQDDPLAMAALHRNTGAALAFEVEEKFQNEVKQGKYKTPEEADAARIEALTAARSKWEEVTGISTDPKVMKAFQKGFDIQQDERRSLVQRLQQDVTDQNYRKQALIGVNTNLTAPLTPEAIAAGGPQFAADYMVRTLSQAQLTGLIRSPEEYMSALNHGLQNLQGVAGGADVLTVLGGTEVDMLGQKGKLRDFLGGGAFDAAVLKARDQENAVNATRYGVFQKALLDVTRTGNLPEIEKMIALREQESGGKTTNEIEALYRARTSVLEQRDRETAKLNEKVTKENEETAQLYAGMEGIRQFSEGGLVSNDYKDLGFKDAAQGRKGEKLWLDTFTNPQEKIAEAIKLAGKFPNGFSANVLQELNDTGKRQFELYVTQVTNGNQNAVVPPQVQNLTAVYENDPIAFGMAFKDAPYVDLHEAGKEVGLSLADMVKSKVKWDALPKDRKAEAEKELNKAIGKFSGGQESYIDKSVRGVAANLMAAGLSAPTAVETAMDRFKKQHVEIDGGMIHKSFFTDNSKDATASEFAEGLFNKTVLPRLKESIGNPEHSALIYSPADRSIWVTDLTTGSRVQYSREQMLEESEKTAEEQRLKANLKQTLVIQKSQAKAEKKAKEMERGFFPNNRTDGDGFSGKPKRNSTK